VANEGGGGHGCSEKLWFLWNVSLNLLQATRGEIPHSSFFVSICFVCVRVDTVVMEDLSVINAGSLYWHLHHWCQAKRGLGKAETQLQPQTSQPAVPAELIE